MVQHWYHRGGGGIRQVLGEDLLNQPARRSERLRKKGGGGGEIRGVGIAEGIASILQTMGAADFRAD